MSFPYTELLLFNYAKVKTVFNSMAPLTFHTFPKFPLAPFSILHIFHIIAKKTFFLQLILHIVTRDEELFSKTL